jgi:hypothetical protein
METTSRSSRWSVGAQVDDAGRMGVEQCLDPLHDVSELVAQCSCGEREVTLDAIKAERSPT